MPTLREGRILDPELETQPDADRRAFLGRRLAATVAHAFSGAPRVRRTLDAAGVSPGDVRGLDDLARLPILRKDDLPRLQAEEPPFGGLAGVSTGALARVFMSPGPIYDPQGTARRLLALPPRRSPRRGSVAATSRSSPPRTT